VRYPLHSQRNTLSVLVSIWSIHR